MSCVIEAAVLKTGGSQEFIESQQNSPAVSFQTFCLLDLAIEGVQEGMGSRSMEGEMVRWNRSDDTQSDGERWRDVVALRLEESLA